MEDTATRREKVLSTEQDMTAAITRLSKKHGSVGGCMFLLFSGPDGGSTGVALQIPPQLRKLMPSLLRSIAFDVEKQNLMAGIATVELGNVTSDVLRDETRKIS